MERYIDIETSQTKHLQSYIRPQWGWKTFALISFFVAVLSFVVVDLDRESTSAYAIELERLYGVECIGVSCDVSDPSSVKNMTDL